MMSSDGEDTSQHDAKVHTTSKRDVTIEMQEMDEGKGSKSDVDNLDMLNRDPNDLNPQLKVRIGPKPSDGSCTCTSSLCTCT